MPCSVSVYCMPCEVKEMERIPCADNSEPERTADGVLKQLRLTLQLLASPPQAQLSHFPAHTVVVVLTDEMALDLEHWVQCVPTYWKLSQEQTAKLTTLDDFLDKMSTSLNRAFWRDEALSTDPRWEEVRSLAKEALDSFGWPSEVPPLARYRYGMLVDGE